MDTATRIEILAAACHSAWYAYTVLGLGEPGETWANAPAWQQASIRNGVRFWDLWVETHKLRVAQSTWDEAYTDLARASYENWANLKRLEGWTYGESKDPEAKTHPCLVEYEDLPEAQKKKDYVAIQAYFAVRPLLPDPEDCVATLAR